MGLGQSSNGMEEGVWLMVVPAMLSLLLFSSFQF